MPSVIQIRIFRGRGLVYESQGCEFYCRELIMRHILRSVGTQENIDLTGTNKTLSIKVSDDYSVGYNDRAYRLGITHYASSNEQNYKDFMDRRAYSKASYTSKYIIPYLRLLYNDRINIKRMVVVYPRFIPSRAKTYTMLPNEYTFTTEFRDKSYIPVEAALTFITLQRLFEPNFTFIENDISIEDLVTKYIYSYQNMLFPSQEPRDIFLFYFYLKTRAYTIHIVPDFISTTFQYCIANFDGILGIPGGGYLGSYIEELYQRSLLDEPFYRTYDRWYEHDTSMSIIKSKIKKVTEMWEKKQGV